MDNKTLNELAIEVHENAVEHGWWQEERSFGEIIALCHSELSEALEEYRNGNDKIRKLLIYYSGGGYVATAPTLCCKKPEGIAVELADCILRILDYCGKEKFDVSNYCTMESTYRPKTDNFAEWISYFHTTLSWSFVERTTLYITGCLREILDYCNKENINIDEAIEIKHEYNKTRPYKHGGKII